jgi:hypothetical protein
MASAIRWLRISFWVGAVVDCVAAIQMLHPPLFGLGMGLHAFNPGEDYRYAMGMGASLMLGWTALLLWADREPLDRRGVLLLTVVPVIAGLAANELRGVRTGFLPLAPVAGIWGLQVLLAALFLASYWRAHQLVRAAPARSGWHLRA